MIWQTMKFFATLISMVLIPLVGPAAEIVAWKVPLSRFVGRGLDEKGIVRCKSAPEASPFFKEGDELWDLKGVLLDGGSLPDSENAFVDVLAITTPPLEWAIWNASLGRLVTKSEWSGIWQLNQRLGMNKLPTQCRITAEVFEVRADGSLLPTNTVPAAVLSCVARSRRDFETSRQNEAGEIRVQGQASIGEGTSFVDMVVEVDCALRNQRRMIFKTGITLRSDTPLWVARDFDGEKGLDVRISCSIELVDGTPARDAVLIQKADIAAPVVVDRKEMERHRVGDKGWLAIQWMDPRELLAFDTGNVLPDAASADPFSEKDPKNIRELVRLSEVRPPDVLKTWFERPVWDLRDLMKKSGVDSEGDTDFTGYDPSAQRVFRFSNDEGGLDKFEELLSPGCNLPPRMVAVTFEGKGLTKMVTRSGRQSRLERSGDEREMSRSFQIEPTIGESADMVEVHLDYRDESHEKQKRSVKTAVTSAVGPYLEVATGSPEGGSKTSLRMKTEIIGTDP